MSLPSDTEISPSQPKAASAPSTPIPTAPPSQDIIAAHKMSEAGTEYFMPDLASPLSTLGRGLVPFTTAPKTLGIDWRYGAQGTNLLVNAAEESRRSGNSTFSSNFERSTYISGLQNLLSGLPPDLRDAEISTLQHAIPPAVVSKIVQESSSSNSSSSSSSSSSGTRDNKPSDTRHKGGVGVYKENLLHKFLLWLFCLIDGWVFFLWPKLPYLYVRMKQISQDNGQEVAGSLGRGALSVAGAIVFVVNQEPVMEATQAISKWTYEGVRGAVTDFVAMKIAERSGSGGKKEGEEPEVKLKAS
ncbi:hypothetical protein B0T09DRAFT_382679 [Sordaria sp. MPI-SDFR-AT-0083]|nr:hypothetical protein B0T09DRAFT_382679 [Sordaria sp. MPI-SDFR-AT-0083]